MAVKQIICVIFFCFLSICRAQQQFTKVYGGSWNEPYHLVPGMLSATNDGGFIICHTTQSYGLPSTNAVFFVRTDSDGDTLLTCTYYRAEGGAMTGRSASEIPGGGYAIFADLIGSEMIVIKTDASGTPQWTKQFPQAGRHGRRLANGDLIMCGGTISAALVRTDASGSVVFAKTYGFPLPGPNVHTLLWSVSECSNGDLVATGSVKFNSSPDRDIFLLRTDHAGNVKFAHKYGTTSHDEYGVSVTETANKQIAVTGICNVYGGTQGEIPLLVVDSTGSVISYNRVGDTLDQHATSLTANDVNEIFIAGFTGYNSAGGITRSGLVVKSNPSGAINSCYLFHDAQYAAGVQVNMGNSVVVSGTSNKLGPGLSNIVLMKVDSTIISGCSVAQYSYSVVPVIPVVSTLALSTNTITGVTNPTFVVVRGSNLINHCAISPTVAAVQTVTRETKKCYLFPNPAFATVYIKNESNVFDCVSVADQTGRIVRKSAFPATKMTEVDIEALAPGFYVITTSNSGTAGVTLRFLKSQ